VWKRIGSNIEKVKDLAKIENAGKISVYENDYLFYGGTGKIGLSNWKTGEVVKTIVYNPKGIMPALEYLEGESVLISGCNGDNKLKVYSRGNWDVENELDAGIGMTGATVIEADGYYVAVYGCSKLIVFSEQ